MAMGSRMPKIIKHLMATLLRHPSIHHHIILLVTMDSLDITLLLSRPLLLLQMAVAGMPPKVEVVFSKALKSQVSQIHLHP
jgi:hypothetical protein